MFPSKPFDECSCWSGSATVLLGNKPAILYTEIIDENQTHVQNYVVPVGLSDPYLRKFDRDACFDQRAIYLIMALVSEGRSTLNPNAPLFVPSSLRQLEDFFSPEWWDLVTTSTWFRDYWLTQNQGDYTFGNLEDCFNGNSELLPDSVDLDMDDDILNMEAQFEVKFQVLSSLHSDMFPTNE